MSNSTVEGFSVGMHVCQVLQSAIDREIAVFEPIDFGVGIMFSIFNNYK
ncbi:MAG: hypothetical protein WBA89_17010 [Microcoleus sp.]